MKTFFENEQTERTNIMELARKDKTFCVAKLSPPSSYCRWDAICFSGGSYTGLVAEIKVRDFNHNKYQDAIIDAKKTAKIIEITKEFNNKFKHNNYHFLPFIFVFYSDCAYGWVLDGTEKISEIKAPLTSSEGGNNTKVIKQMTHLNFNDGKKFEI